jgi:hypothetical protein
VKENGLRYDSSGTFWFIGDMIFGRKFCNLSITIIKPIYGTYLMGDKLVVFQIYLMEVRMSVVITF